MTTITVHPIPDLTRASQRLQKPLNEVHASLTTALQYPLTYAFATLPTTCVSVSISVDHEGEILAVYEYESGRKFVMGGIPRPERTLHTKYGTPYFDYSFHS